MRPSSALLPLLVLLGSCTPRGGPCVDDADCQGDPCLHDLDRGDHYCSALCEADHDCPEQQLCDVRITGAPGDQSVTSLCIERVRQCGEAEVCNGLDDDCDGETDESCTVQLCAADVHCGGLWTCAPSYELQDLACRAPLPGSSPFGTLCVDNTTCPNGLCDTGRCAPLCSEDADCASGQRCARPSSSTSSLAHQICHDPCDSETLCDPSMVCTWRGDPANCRWRAVCSPTRGARNVGQSCLSHDECKSALCVGRICTRPCAVQMDCSPHGLTCEPVYLSTDPLRCDVTGMTVCQ
ncbi:MAG: hypothetical protein ABIJ09_09665 [Pseudomonadota bacterium]